MSLIFTTALNRPPVHWTCRSSESPYEKVRGPQARDSRKAGLSQAQPQQARAAARPRRRADLRIGGDPAYLGEMFGVEKGLYPSPDRSAAR